MIMSELADASGKSGWDIPHRTVASVLTVTQAAVALPAQGLMYPEGQARRSDQVVPDARGAAPRPPHTDAPSYFRTGRPLSLATDDTLLW